MAENIGELECHICGVIETALIRKKKANKGNYPLYLWHKKTGPQFFNTVAGQDWILESGVFYDENGDLPDHTVNQVQEIEKPEPAAVSEDVVESNDKKAEKPAVKTEKKADDNKSDEGWFL